MRRRFVLWMLLGMTALSPGCTLWREKKVVNNWADATGGEGLERSFWKDVKDKNWTELERHVASNYVAFTPEEGRMDRATMLQHLQGARLDDFSLGDFQVELNTNTLVVTYSISMSGSFAGRPLPTQPVRMMTVWQQQKAGWLAIAHTVIGPEAK
ncbi:MAG: nuclear transport factor 2 family protein [Acidobacteriia bacterium]|nr:nuclear transport factor 2 family protein [Terriglobia bacterium]